MALATVPAVVSFVVQNRAIKSILAQDLYLCFSCPQNCTHEHGYNLSILTCVFNIYNHVDLECCLNVGSYTAFYRWKDCRHFYSQLGLKANCCYLNHSDFWLPVAVFRYVCETVKISFWLKKKESKQCVRHWAGRTRLGFVLATEVFVATSTFLWFIFMVLGSNPESHV